MAVEDVTIYIKGDQNVEVTERKVTIGDIVEVECVDSHILAKVKSLCIVRIPDGGKHRCVISILSVVEKIHEEFPKLKVEILGPPDMIVTYEPRKNQNHILEGLKVGSVLAIIFVGAAFSIMTFNNDVDIPKLFSQVYEQIMGRSKTGFSILEATYSIGIALGILIFFNHFGKKRFSVDPTPIEVEMRIYEDEIQNALIQKYEREGKEQSAGKTNHSSNHRP